MLKLPKVVFGATALGNIYQAIPYDDKREIVRECLAHSNGFPVFDSAGKYGAGLSLEVLGKTLRELGADPAGVLISNKLGWYRVPLKGPHPTFERDIWVDIGHDAEQRISYHGIMQCFEQGEELLDGFHSQLVSVHDPDEYLARDRDKEGLYEDILDAYRALHELKRQGRVLAVGIGAKDWKTIRRIAQDVELDWVMTANSLTLHSHPAELIRFLEDLGTKGVAVINSAVFNGGFLTGSDYYNYHRVIPGTPEGDTLLGWRDRFWKICSRFDIAPPAACVSFGLKMPGVTSIAMSTSRPEKVKANVAMATLELPVAFWNAIAEAGLVEPGPLRYLTPNANS